MNTSELLNVLMSHPVTKRHLGGIVASDQLPERNSSTDNDKYYIINLDPSTEPGSHWVACFLFKDKDDLYFDSYGFPPFVPHIIRFLSSSNFSFNTTPVQDPLSTSCGQWCLLFVWWTLCGWGMDSFIKHYDRKFGLHNEARLEMFLKTVFDFDKTMFDGEFFLKQMSRSFLDNQTKYGF